MCIIAVALNASPRLPFVLAANRDERHARPTAAAHWWEEAPHVLAGRDLVAGGSWLGITRGGRVAAVTNIFEPGQAAAPRSRGEPVARFLMQAPPLDRHADDVAADAGSFGPFNLLLYAEGRLRVISNRSPGANLADGVHAFSNNGPGEDWPKVERVRSGIAALKDDADPTEGLFEMLGERGAPRVSAADSIFIVGPDFGTRSSSVVLMDGHGRARFSERRFDADGALSGASRFEFEVDAASP